MQWISKKNQHIASRARLKSSPAARTENETPPTKKKWRLIASGLSNALARATGTLAGASITLVTSFLGAAAAAYLTINYLESFKAQEALRTFAVTQLYQPLRQKSLKCHELRIEATSNARIVSNTSELVLLHLKDIRNRKEKLSLDNTKFILPIVKEIFEHYTKASVQLSKLQDEIALCEREVAFASHELATVLGLNDQFSTLNQQFIKSTPKHPTGQHYSAVIDYLGNPKLINSLIQAFEDAENGHPERADSALSRIQSDLEKTAKSAADDLTHKRRLLNAGFENDTKTISLFLNELRKRFELAPEISPAQVLEDLKNGIESNSEAQPDNKVEPTKSGA